LASLGRAGPKQSLLQKERNKKQKTNLKPNKKTSAGMNKKKEKLAKLGLPQRFL
jgi:hypothetical protein